MSGTKLQTEGMPGLVCKSEYISGSNELNSVEGIDIESLTDGAVCYVRDTQLSFRWDDTSLAAPSPSTVILPSSVALADPGRWILITGGGGGGSVNSVIGAGSISTINPGGPVVTVDGTALLPRDGSRAMTGDLNMGAQDIQNVVSVNGVTGLTLTTPGGNLLISTAVGDIDAIAAGDLRLQGATLSLNGGTTALTWPPVDGAAGQALVTNGAGVLSFATVSAAPAAPANSVQYNNGGVFGGSAQNIFVPGAGVVGVSQTLTSPSNVATGNRFGIDTSTAAPGVLMSFSEDPNPLNWFSTVSGAGFFQVEAYNGVLELKSATGTLITVGATSWSWPTADGTAGQFLQTDGAGALSFATAVTGPAAPDRSVQFNNAGVFDGSSQLLFNASATERALQIGSNAVGTTFAGIRFRKSTLATAAEFYYNEVTNKLFLTSNVDVAMSATGTFGAGGSGATLLSSSGSALTLQAATNGLLSVGSSLVLESLGGNLLINSGTALKWPTADGTAGQVMTTNGAGVLSFSTPTAGLPVATIQNITVAGPTAITNTMNTLARVNFAGAASVTLPAGAVGKQITVKDVSGLAGTNNITVTGGTIDGAASYVIATNRGSATFVCASTGPDVWDVI